MFHPSRGAVKLTRRGRDDLSMARLPSSFSNHTSPHSTRGPSAFSVNGGEQLGVGGLNLTMPLGVLNFGPTFGSQGGRQTVLPPTRGARYQVLAAHHRHRRPCRGGDPDGRHRSARRHEHRVEFVRSWAAREGLMRVDRSVVFGLRRLALNDSPVATRVARSRSDTGITQASYKRSGRATEDSVARRYLLEEDGEIIIKMAEDSNILCRPRTSSPRSHVCSSVTFVWSTAALSQRNSLGTLDATVVCCTIY